MGAESVRNPIVSTDESKSQQTLHSVIFYRV